MASVAVSAAIHAFLLSLGFSPPAPTDGREATAHVPPTLPSAIRITGIVVAEPAARLASTEAAAERVVAELTAPQRDVPAPVPESAPEDSAPKLDLESPATATLAPATLLSARSASPLLWRSVRDASPVPPYTSVVPLRDRVDDGKPGYTPIDAWAFSTWTARDAESRLWGAAPGVIYVFGLPIPTCGGRFDASNCGFGAPGWRRGKYQRFLRTLTEIERQVGWGAVMERSRAIRERREAERSKERDTVPGIRNDS